MPHEDFVPPGLPKWPAMVVVGDPVTAEQAAEIIVRLDHAIPDPCCNDKEWERQIKELLGTPEMPSFAGGDSEEELAKRRAAWKDYQDRSDALNRSLGKIDGIEYLSVSRVAAAYVGGPNGWIDWRGQVFSAGHNIGKWPTAEAVLDEWKIIAREFPFLRLTCRLFDREATEDDHGPHRPLVDFHVTGGEACMTAPGSTMLADPAGDRDMAHEIHNLVYNPLRERGCSIEKLRWAVHRVRAKFAPSVA